MMYARKRIGLSLLVSLVTVACAPIVEQPVSVSDLPQTESRTHARTFLSDQFVISPGTELGIKFFYTPELNEEVVVRPDGRISLQLVPEQMAAGRTPSELRKELETQYASELKQAEIAVIVRTFGPQQVFIDGEVNTPGVLDLLGPTTLLQSVAFAGGFTDRALKQEVVVIRQKPNEKAMVIVADLHKVLNGSDTSQDFRVLPFDIVYVPRNRVSNLNVWVDQYVRKNIPIPIIIDFK